MPNPKRTAPGFNRFSGLAQGILRWAGARRSGNAASIPPNMFRDLENVRFEGQDIICRGGQVKYNPSTVLTGCIDGFIPPDFEPPSFEALMLVVGADTDTSTAGTLTPLRNALDGVDIIDATTLEDTSSLSYTAGAGTGGSGGSVWQGKGHTGGNDVGLVGFTLDENNVIVAGLTAQVVNTADAAWGQVCKFNGSVFAVVSRHTGGGNGESHVYFDPGGTGEAVDRTATGTDVQHGYFPMWLRHHTSDNTLVAPLEPAVLHYRSTAGAWATAAMPASTAINRGHQGSAAMFNSNLYFAGTAAGGGNAIFQYSGVTITQVNQPTGIPPTRQPLCSHNGSLWYCGSPSGLVLGNYDGTTWDDSVFTFTDADPVVELASYNGKLYAFKTNSVWVAEHPDRFWEQLNATANAYAFAALYFVV